MELLLHRRRTLALAASLLLTACATTRTDLPGPGADRVLAHASHTLPPGEAEWPAPHWWESFGDPGLTRIIDEALAANPDLQTASARARAVAAVAQSAAAALRPSVGASASVTRERLSESGLAPPPYGGSWLTASDVSAALSWKLDLFGAERARIAARRAEASAARADAAFARSATSAAVARLYFELGAALADRDEVDATLAQRRALLKVTHGRHDAGLDSTADLRQAEAQVPALEVERARADERVAVDRAALAAMLGTGPDDTATLVPAPPSQAPAWSLPADLRLELLARRADVVAARARVEAAAHDVDAIRRDYLPNLSLSAVAGLDSLVPSVLFNGSSRQITAGPAISLPLYDGGRRRAATAAQQAEFEAARAAYQRTVVGAVEDVANAVARLNASADSRRSAAAALSAQRDALRIAELRYRNGLGTLLEVLSIQDRVLTIERQAVTLEHRERTLRVDLYEALGGGTPPAGAES